MRPRSIVLAGVGGQGVVLASAILAEAALQADFEVKQSEVHGMAQRGGAVVSHIRYGDEVASPVIPLATADVLAGFEWAEALRWMPYLRPDGVLVVDVRRIVPPGACRDHRTWNVPYPPLRLDTVESRAATVHLLDATGIARELGNAKAANSVILGAMSRHLDLPDVAWEKAIGRFVPTGTEELNVAAFHAGKEAPPVDPTTIPDLGLGPLPERDYRIELDRTWCKDCGICPSVCPEFCLAMDRAGTLQVVDEAACTGCRLCEVLCPDFAIRIAAEEPQPAGGTR